MTFTELPEPSPREQPISPLGERMTFKSREFLNIPAKPADVSFWDVIANRRSRRRFGRMDRTRLSEFLWNGVKSRETSLSRCGVRWQSRPYPSAGGIYPIDVLLVEPTAAGCRCAWYNAVSHSLDTPQMPNSQGADTLFAVANEVIPAEEGTVLWFVANFSLCNAMYSNPESLVWRDSGALLSALCFVAEALQIACCALGATGSQQIRTTLGLGHEYAGVGGCIIGSRVPEYPL